VARSRPKRLVQTSGRRLERRLLAEEERLESEESVSPAALAASTYTFDGEKYEQGTWSATVRHPWGPAIEWRASVLTPRRCGARCCRRRRARTSSDRPP
jgi:hypothetical protein